MKRTRKWAYVAQEATRLAGIGLSVQEIAQHIGVDRSTVNRWFQSGKLSIGRTVVDVPVVSVRQSPAEWAKAARETFQLDASDDQLVTGGEIALTAMHDARLPIGVRLAALGRFQAVLKQLAVVSRGVEAESKPPEESKPKPVELRRTGTDPRALMVVK